MKKILSLLVLVVMAITGGRCFATNYDIWVAGVRVTSSNASNITGSHIQGSVSYNPTTNVLTLNQATIDEPKGERAVIIVSQIGSSGQFSHLTIELIGDNYLSVPDWRSHSVIEAANLTFQGSGSVTIEGRNPIECRELYITGGSTVYALAKKFDNTDHPVAINAISVTVQGSTLYASKQLTDNDDATLLAYSLTLENSHMVTPTNYEFANGNMIVNHQLYQGDVVIVPGDFQLWVAGIQVTPLNASDVFGDGNVSFDWYTNTLTLNNSHFSSPEMGIQSLYDELTLNLIGESSIYADYNGLNSTGNLIIQGLGSLDVEADWYGIYSHGGDIIFQGDGTFNITGGWNGINADGGNLIVKNGTDLNVVGTQYNAVVGTTGKTFSIQNSTVTATSQSGYYTPIQGFTDLDMVGCGISSPLGAEWDATNHYMMYNGSPVIGQAVSIGTTPFPLSVAGQMVTVVNYHDVLGDGKVSFDFNTNTLTLHNAYIVNNNNDPETRDGICNLGIDGLVIELVGQNTIKKACNGIYTEMHSTILTGSGTLTIGDDVTYGIYGCYPGSSLTIEQGCKVYVEGAQYGIDMPNGTLTVNNTELRASGSLNGSIKVHHLNLNDTEITSPADAYWDSNTGFVKVGNQNVKETVVIKPISYDLSVGGVAVDHANYSDVLGDGTVSYDPVSKVLSLEDANITYNGRGISNKIEGLKIKLYGSNRIVSNQGDGIYSEKDLFICGAGKLNVYGHTQGIHIRNSNLSIYGGCLVDAVTTGSGNFSAIRGYDELNNQRFYLNITESDVKASGADPNACAIDGFYDIVLDGSSICYPVGAEYSSQYHRMRYLGADYYGGVDILCDTYDLIVGDVQVTKANADSIKGPGISGTVTYDAHSTTLTLEDATIETDEISAIWSDISDLTIVLVGDNTIISTNNNGKGIFYENNVLNIQGEGSLEVHAAYGIYAPYTQSSMYVNINSRSRVILGDDDSHMQYGIWASNGIVSITQSYVWAYGETASILCQSLTVVDDVIFSPYSAYCNGTYVCYSGTNNPVKNEPVIINPMLSIQGITVDSHNCNDVLEDGGSVHYDIANTTLYLYDANIGSANSNSSMGISSYINDLIIHLQGVSNVSAQSNYGLYSNGNLIIEGPGDLTVWGNDGNIEILDGNLTLRDVCTVTSHASGIGQNPSAVRGSQGYSLTVDRSTLICSTDSNTAPIYQFSNLVLNHTEITTPSGAEWDMEERYLVNNGNKVLGTVIIEPESYHIIVAGNEVTSANCADVLKDGSVHYDAYTNTLVLHNASITCPSQVSDGIENVDADGLTIWLEGYNYITANDDGIDTYSNATTITGPGELYIVSPYGIYGNTVASMTIAGGCYVEINAASFGVNLTGQGSLTVDHATLKAAGKSFAAIKTINFTLDGCSISSPTGAMWDETSHYVTSDDVVVKGAGNYVVIEPQSYNLWVADVQVDEINVNDVLGDGTVVYDPEQNVLTLTNAAIQNDNGYGIRNEISGLTIQLESLNAIVADNSGIYSTQDLTIQGTGMLMVSGSDGIYMSNANLTIDNTMVWATGTRTGNYAGIYGNTSKTLTINNSAVTAENPYSLLPVSFGDLSLSEECAITAPANTGWTNEYHRFYIQEGDSFTFEISRVNIAPVTKYDLWVAGNQVNSANAADILGNSSAVYTPADRVLTLTNAEIHNILSANVEDRDGIRNTGIEGLTIVLIGTNTIDVEDDGINTDFYSTTITGTGSLSITSNYGIYGDGSNTTVSIVDGCSLEIDATYNGIATNMADLLIRNASVKARGENEFSIAANTLTLEGCEITSPDGAQWNPQYQMVEDENNQPVTDFVIISPMKYNLYVKGMQVTALNAFDVLGDGTVSYDASQKVLTFNNVNIHENTLAFAVQNKDVEGLTIQLIGDNTIYLGGNSIAIDMRRNTTVKGPGTLNITSQNGFYLRDADLTICDGCLIDITASTVSFNTNMNSTTLSIRDSEVRTTGFSTPIIVGYLELDGCTITQPQGAEWDPSIGNVTLDGEIVTGQIVISPESLPLWVGGTQVTTLNAFDILGNGQAVYDRFDKVLTLKNAYISTLEYGITNQISNLTIKLEGSSLVEGAWGGIYTDGDLYIQGPGALYCSGGDGMMIDNANLYFEEGCSVTSIGHGGNMYAGICGKTGFSMTVTNSSVYAENTNPDAAGQIYGFTNLNLFGCSITSPLDAVWNKTRRQVCVNNIPVTTMVCINNEIYDLYVSGVRVTSGNSSDVLGDGTVSFNRSDAILTLNNANIDYSNYIYSTGILDMLDYLVIELIGENSIKAGYYGIHMFDGITRIQGDGKLSITSSNAGISGTGFANLELNSCNLSVDGSVTGIDMNGDGTIRIDGATIKTRGETYGSLMAGDIVMRGVEVSQPSDAFIGQLYENDMYYALDENANIVTDWTWIEPLNSFEATVNNSWYNANNWSRGTRPTANSKVYINANCNVDRSYEVNEIFIKGDNVLTINSDVILETNLITGQDEDSSIDDDQLVILEGGQILYYGDYLNGTIETSVNAWGEGTGWTLISSPLRETDVEDNTDFLDVAGNQYDLYRYVESNRHNNEWQNYKRVDFDEFDKGRGYLYANVNAVSHNFHGAFNIDAVTYTVTYTAPEDDYPLAGFNLIGNPFIHNIYKGSGAAINNANLDNGYYTLSDEGTWVAQTDDTPIPPCTGILVRTSATANVTITNTMDEPNLNKGGSRMILVVNGQGFNDQVILAEGTGKSLVKLNHMNAAAPMLYCTEDGKDYAIVEKQNLEGQYALGFKAATYGTYTISLSESNREVTLIDTLTGAKTNLSKGAYTFKASPEDSTERFIVEF